MNLLAFFDFLPKRLMFPQIIRSTQLDTPCLQQSKKKKARYDSSNSTASSVEILQMLRSIEFPLRFIQLDDHKLVYLEYFRSYFLLLLLLLSTFKNKNTLRTIEAEIS